MTENLQSTHDIIKAKLGLEKSPYKKRVITVGDRWLNFWFYSEPQPVLETQVQTVIFVHNTKTGKFPFIELYGFELDESQIDECIDKFKVKPESFNNQKND